ncbi:MAG TPA: peptidylprolyl isomerase [Coriobacteriia bacterium]|nr:peptidylprolyl isomerase [Coriobacteriia bacterium]
MAASDGQTVIVHYTGTLADGSEFDSSKGRDPLMFTVGTGEVIPGFDEAVRGLEPGESKTVTIPADQAYGPRTEEAFQRFPRDAFPPEPEPEIGWMVELQSEEGQRVPAAVSEVGDDFVVLDFNHPLAGQDLTFEIELVSIEPEGEPAE